MSASLFLVRVFWIVIGVITLIGLFAAIQAFRGKISWGKARYMGMTKILFSRVNSIYHLVLLEAAYGVVSFFLDLPLWSDISLILLILMVLMIVYRELKRREKFKPDRFKLLFLIPLGFKPLRFRYLFLIPLGIHGPVAVGKMMLPTEYPVKKFIQRFFKETPTETSSRKAPNYPLRNRVGDSGYEIEFRDPHSKGRFGDSLTARRLTAQGYRKEPSKLDTIHGIDGVYIQYYDNGSPREILIVESKVDSGKLGTKQMTDERIAELVERMLVHADPEVRRTGKLIRENPDLVRKELWHHYLANGKTTVSRLNAEAIETLVKTLNYIESATRKRCESSNPGIVCIPATQ